MGILCYSDPEDTSDWYQFYVEEGKTIKVTMSPPSGIDLDLQLYDPSGSLKVGSYYGPGSTEAVTYIADSTGYWRARIYIVSGEGMYTFSVTDPAPGGGEEPPGELPESGNPSG